MRRLLLVVSALLLAAGGLGVSRLLDRSTPTAGTPSSVGPAQLTGTSGYLAQLPNYVVFLQLTLSGNTVTGTWSAAILHDTRVTPATLSVSGSWDTNGHLSVTVGSSGYSGTWSSDGINLSIQQSNGSLATLAFHRSDSDAYNTAVANLQSQAVGAATAQQEQQQQASADAAAASAATAAALAATKDRNCRAINGHVDHRGGFLDGWCDSIVPGDPSGEAGSECSDAQLPFNGDGTIERSFLETANGFYKGCWPAASSVSSSVAH